MVVDYWNATDRKSVRELELPLGRLGASTPPMADQLKELKSKIFAGLSQVELGFWGKSKGSRSQNQPTPGSYGRDEREAMRQLAKINEVELTTHAAPQAGNLAGIGKEGFNKEEQARTVHEINRATDFAAEVAQGGPVVVHTGEFPRPIMAVPEGKEKFIGYEEEEKQRIHHLIDKHSGQLVKTVREDETIWRPDTETDPKTGKEETRHDPYLNKDVPVYKLDINGNIQVTPIKFSEYKEDYIKKHKELSREEATNKAALEFFEQQQQAKLQEAHGKAEEHEVIYKKSKGTREKLIDIYEYYKTLPESGKERYWRDLEETYHWRLEKGQTPHDIFKEQIRETDKRMTYSQEIAVSARKEFKGIQANIANTTSLEDYGVAKSSESLANAAMHALKKEKAMNLKKPLYISPENLFPEQYGAHPQELKRLVFESRQKMVDKLKRDQPKLSNAEAKRIATNHIKATFDIGHAYTWKKYFKGPKKEFDRWILDQAKDLQKSGVLGHIHVSDNFGYDDEHITPGQGDVPIKEFMKEMEKAGFKGKFVTEAGGQPEGKAIEAPYATWKLAGSPIFRTEVALEPYRIDALTRSLTDAQGSYFGRTQGPTYLVGDTAPSKDWTLFTEVGLE